MSSESWVVVTSYVRPDGRVVRHVYSNATGTGYLTRSRAQTAVKRLLRDNSSYGHDVDALLKSGRLEINPVKVITS